MIKVLHIMAGADAGGISSVVYNYYVGMDRSRIHFDIALTTDSFGINGEKLKELGCSFYHLPLKSVDIKHYKSELKNLLLKNKYDAIHVHENETSYVALAIANKIGIRIRIAHSHTSSPRSSFKGEVKRLIGCWLNYKYATHLIACGQLAGERVFGKHHMTSSKALILYNAIDCTKYRFDPEFRVLFRNENNLSGKFVIGLVGRLSAQKNQVEAIRIVNEYHKINDKAVLYIVGNGEDEEKLKSFVKRHNMDSFVRFLGSRTDVNKLYSAFDVSILTSLYEGFPVVGVESLVSGLPLIISDTITSELSKFCNVKYCSLNNDEEWISALGTYQERERTASYDSDLLKKFNINNNIEKLERIYMRS